MPTLRDDQLLRLIQQEPWYKNKTQSICALDLLQLGVAVKQFANHLIKITRFTESLCAQERAAVPQHLEDNFDPSNIVKRAELLKETLTRHWEEFRFGPASYLLPCPLAITHCDETVQTAWQHMYQRIVDEFPKQIAGCYAVLDRLITTNQHSKEDLS